MNGVEINIRNNYDFISSYYDDAFYNDFTEENLIISLVIDYFVKTKKPNVATEFGCGTGFWLKIFVENNINKIVAVDCSEKMLDICKLKYNNTGIRFQNLNFTNTSLFIRTDLVLTAFLFSALDYKFFENVINNIYNILNNDGIFVFIDNIPTNSDDFQELVLLEKWGDKTINCKYTLYNLDFLVYTLKEYNFKIIFKFKLGSDIQIVVCKKSSKIKVEE